MSYTPTEWKSGDVITAEKLNKIEDGISNISASMIKFETSNFTSGTTVDCNLTASDIFALCNGGFNGLVDNTAIPIVLTDKYNNIYRCINIFYQVSMGGLTVNFSFLNSSKNFYEVRVDNHDGIVMA